MKPREFHLWVCPSQDGHFEPLRSTIPSQRCPFCDRTMNPVVAVLDAELILDPWGRPHLTKREEEVS